MSELAKYPLIDALLDRRSRRFAKGRRLNGGPLAYESQQTVQPLTLEEEALLAFAACGITGYALGELPYHTGDAADPGGGNIMTNFTARTVASGDALHCSMLLVVNDSGVWMVKRPQDFPRTEIPELIDQARRRRWVDLYERSRVRIGDGRVDPPREVPFGLPFNQWSAHQPGTTCFLPVTECTAFYINVLLSAFSEESALFPVDEHRGFRPAGVGAFARSRGGHLVDDPKAGRIATIGVLETWLYEFAAIEQGAMHQNLGLMSQALGLGGFPYFAAHPFAWLRALGFGMQPMSAPRFMGVGPVARFFLRLIGRDITVPVAVGLERGGEPLVKPFCPPYYRDMEEAVLAFVDYKYAEGTGTFRDGGAATAWRDGGAVQSGIPRYSDRTIDAVVAYCRYVYERRGRFPAASGPFRTVLAFQAHHLDLDFYRMFYRSEALSVTQRAHQERWHAAES